jgi:hypothetical protein
VRTESGASVSRRACIHTYATRQRARAEAGSGKQMPSKRTTTTTSELSIGTHASVGFGKETCPFCILALLNYLDLCRCGVRTVYCSGFEDHRAHTRYFLSTWITTTTGMVDACHAQMRMEVRAVESEDRWWPLDEERSQESHTGRALWHSTFEV